MQNLTIPVPIRLESREVQQAYHRSCQEKKAGSVVRCGLSSAVVASDAFDTDCFGIPMGQISSVAWQPADAAVLTAACVGRAKELGLRHLAVRVPASAVFMAQALAESGFFMVDT